MSLGHPTLPRVLRHAYLRYVRETSSTVVHSHGAFTVERKMADSISKKCSSIQKTKRNVGFIWDTPDFIADLSS